MKYIKFLGLSLIILLGIKSTLMAQPTVLTGTTTRQASQLIFWYDQAFDQIPLGRFSLIQVTNAADTPVRVKVQFFASSNPDPGNPNTAVRCVQKDFFDRYTPHDTHVYDLFEIFTNQLVGGFPVFVDINVLNTKGFVVVTAVDSDGEAVAHQHLFGTSYVFDTVASLMHRLNAMGRDAVDFNTPFEVVPDGTVLDGIDAGLVLIQPDILKWNFENLLTRSPEIINLYDVISISFKDNYGGAFGGAYAAEPGSVIWDNPIIIDDEERPISCDAITQDCFFDIGLNEPDEFPFTTVVNPLLDGSKVYCPGNTYEQGWARTEVTGYDGLENELGIFAFNTSRDAGDAYWMHVEPPAAPPPPPPTPTAPPTLAPTLPPTLAPTLPPTLAPTLPPTLAPTQAPGTGSSGCSIVAGTASIGTSFASILIPLIPVFGIGLRRIFRRRSMKVL